MFILFYLFFFLFTEIYTQEFTILNQTSDKLYILYESESSDYQQSVLLDNNQCCTIKTKKESHGFTIAKEELFFESIVVDKKTSKVILKKDSSNPAKIYSALQISNKHLKPML